MSSPFLTGTNEEVYRRPDAFQKKPPVKSIVQARMTQERPFSAFRYQRPPSVEDPAKKEEKTIESWNALRIKIRGYESRPNHVSDDTHTNIRPGLRFWEYIVLANPRIDKPRLIVPYSLVNCPGNQQYLIYTDPQTGRLVVNSEVNYPEFEKFLLRRMEETIEGPNRDATFAQYTGIEPGSKKPDYEDKKRAEFEALKKEKILKFEEKKDKQYFYIMRKRNTDNEASTEVFTFNKWAQSRSNILSFDDNSILQEFIYPRGPKACVTRLFYFTKHNKEMKANFGYKIRNKYELHDLAERAGIDQMAVVNKTDDPKIGAFTVNHLSGVSLVEYEAYAEELVTFLERAYPVRIKSITLDFITDHMKRHVLFNVKDIDLDHMEASSKDPHEKKRTLDELTCSVYCKLCGLIFKKDEASKTLTYKLLWELAQHLKKRGKGLQGIEVSHSSTRPCRVCDLCYMVVVSEHELIELEQQFARVQNIPISDPYLRVPIEKKAKHRPALLGETLKQWRFMIYLQTLNFEGENLFKTNNIDKDSVHLQVKLFRIKNDFPLNLVEIAKDPNSTIEEGYDYTYSYEINLLRVYYFFSDKQDIKNFLQDTELQVRLTYTKDWNNYIAQGSTRTLSQFDNNRLKGQKHESRIYMFFDSAEYCTIRFTAGLVCDGDFNTASMNLHKFNGIYFPNDDFYNCNIFPEEWIEIFMDQKKDEAQKEGNEGVETKGKPYTPVCTPAEMRKMLEPNHHSNRIEVESKVEHHLDFKKHEEFKKQLKMERESKKSRPYSMYSNQDDVITMQTNLKGTLKQSEGQNLGMGGSNKVGTGAAFRLRKPQTADPRRPRTNREKSVESETEMYIKKQVREYKEQEKVDPLSGVESKLLLAGKGKHEIFDNSEDFEQEYGPNPGSGPGGRRLASAQEHRQFLNKYQMSAQGIHRPNP